MNPNTAPKGAPGISHERDTSLDHEYDIVPDLVFGVIMVLLVVISTLASPWLAHLIH